MNKEAIQRVLAQLEDNIARFGWAVQGVFPCVGDEDSIPFHYTIGLHNKVLPELLVFGLPMDVGQMLLNDVAMVMLEKQAAGLPVLGKFTHDRWPAPFYLVEAESAKAVEYATGANRRSQGLAKYIQVVWPDKHGSFPWQAGVAQGYLEAQPVLGNPPKDSFN